MILKVSIQKQPRQWLPISAHFLNHPTLNTPSKSELLEVALQPSQADCFSLINFMSSLSSYHSSIMNQQIYK